jgi:hypothetical protein
VQYPNQAIPRYFVERDGSYMPNPSYRGECFWLETGDALPRDMSSNRIVAKAATSMTRILVVNQNFHADWRSPSGTVIAHEGLLALRVPAGSETVELSYRSSALITGVWIGALGLIVLSALCLMRQRFSSRWACSGNALVRGMARALAWILP